MRALAPSELLALWERTLVTPAGEQPLALAAMARPEAARDQLADLPLGERDALLMALRERNFGRRVEAVARCPRCDEVLELALDLAELRAAQPAPGDAQRRLTVGDVGIEYRLLSTRDMQRAAAEPDEGRARAALLSAAVVAAERDGERVAADALPAEVAERLAAQLERDDPLSDVRIAVRCPACDQGWAAPFDITAFLIAEVRAHARRLLDEVHALASAYHWHERDILALSPVRRQAYLELLGR
jgi:hypothetical protein